MPDRLAAIKGTSPNCTTHRDNGNIMKSYLCIVCGFVYDESVGMPDEGFPAGTEWADVPADWVCPDCGAAKADFEMVEI